MFGIAEKMFGIAENRFFWSPYGSRLPDVLKRLKLFLNKYLNRLSAFRAKRRRLLGGSAPRRLKPAPAAPRTVQFETSVPNATSKQHRLAHFVATPLRDYAGYSPAPRQGRTAPAPVFQKLLPPAPRPRGEPRVAECSGGWDEKAVPTSSRLDLGRYDLSSSTLRPCLRSTGR